MKKFKSEYIVAMAAIFVSIATLFVYIYQARIMQSQQHASVWPYIEWLYSSSSEEGYSIIVQNKGVGPAIIKSARMKLDGVELQPAQLLDSLLGSSDIDGGLTDVENRVLAPGELVKPFFILDKQKAAQFDSLIRTGNYKFEYDICFCSIYDDCWTSTGVNVVESRCN